MESYCVTCDAPNGECDHSGPRYLGPIAYERVLEGGRVRWRVPDAERADWDQRLGIETTLAAVERVVPLEVLQAKCERLFFVSAELRRRLSAAYGELPVRMTRLVEHVCSGAQDGSLRKPDAMLHAELRAEGF